MNISEVVGRLKKLYDGLKDDNYNNSHQWNKGYRKGYREAIKTVLILLRSYNESEEEHSA